MSVDMSAGMKDLVDEAVDEAYHKGYIEGVKNTITAGCIRLNKLEKELI